MNFIRFEFSIKHLYLKSLTALRTNCTEIEHNRENHTVFRFVTTPVQQQPDARQRVADANLGIQLTCIHQFCVQSSRTR